MTSLGFPGLSTQSVSGFLVSSLPENSETDWDDKLGLPRVVIPVRFGFCWDDKPGLPRVVIPVRFGCFLALFGQKTPKQTGMTSLGFPGLSSQSVLVFWVFFGQKTPKRTGMTSLGFPGCHPSPFMGFWPLSARKQRNGLG